MISPQLSNSTEKMFPNVGHADLLDDLWADVGKATIPWMKGATSPSLPFSSWSLKETKKEKSVRGDYREKVAADVLEHLLLSHEKEEEGGGGGEESDFLDTV